MYRNYITVSTILNILKKEYDRKYLKELTYFNDTNDHYTFQTNFSSTKKAPHLKLLNESKLFIDGRYIGDIHNLMVRQACNLQRK